MTLKELIYGHWWVSHVLDKVNTPHRKAEGLQSPGVSEEEVEE